MLFRSPLACAALVVDCGKFFAPARVHEPGGIAGMAGAPAALFGMRALIVMAGELVLARAPLIVSFAVGFLGYAGTETLLTPAEGTLGGTTMKSLTHTAGPLLGASLALLIAEVAGRLLGKNRG